MRTTSWPLSGSPARWRGLAWMAIGAVGSADARTRTARTASSAQALRAGGLSQICAARAQGVDLMANTDTGESTASIVRATNLRGWDQILPLLRAGRPLRRESTGRYYVDGNGSLTAACVARLEREGVLRRIGVDTYALADQAR